MSWLGAGGIGSARRMPLRRPRLQRPRLRSLLTIRGMGVLLGIAVVVLVGWLWFRGSSFVAIRQVTVTGVAGPDATQIRDALINSAETMTTLDLSVSKLDQAVSPYPAVRSLSISTSFPHSVSIAVDEQVPLAEVTTGGQMIAVDSRGLLLRGSTAPHGLLPNLPLRPQPTGDRITSSGALAALAVLEAAPYRLLSHIRSATWSQAHGVIVQLRNGPQLFFGPQGQASAKWSAAVAVLADSHSQGASYIDLSDPQRPAAGAITAIQSTHAAAATAAGATGSDSSAASGTSGTSTAPPTGTTAGTGTTSTSG